MNRVQRIILTSFFVVVGFLFSISTVQAATIYASSSYSGTESGTEVEPYNTFHEAYVAASSGDTIDAHGTFDWDNGAGETGDVTSYGYRIQKNITINGHGASSTIFQSDSVIDSSNKRVFTIYNGYTFTVNSSTIRYGESDSTGWSGGCINSESGSSVVINNSDVYGCRVYGGYGFGMYVLGNLTITNSAIYNNVDSIYNGYGAGIYFSSSTGQLVITNSSIYGNRNTSSGSNGGGGVYIGSGTATITNSTITDNTIYSNGGGVGLGSSATLYLSNTIIADNIVSSGSYNDLYRGAGTINNSGYNIIGPSHSFTPTTGDWTDSDSDDIYDLYSIGTTSTLNLNSGGEHTNQSLNETHTIAIYTGSMAINNATTTANNGVSIPSADQRGAGRTGATDIGAFEFDGTGLPAPSAPTTQASEITFSTIEMTSYTVSWTNGNGARRVAFVKQADSGTASPVDTTMYTASSVFGSGDQIGETGWYAIYDGVDSSVTVTGLTGTTDYIVQVFEYNGEGVTDGIVYLSSTSTNNPNTQISYTPTTIYVNYNTGNDSTGDGSTETPYKTFYKAYSMYVDSDIFDMTGTFDWTATGESGDLSNSGYTIAKNITIIGHGADQTIFQADDVVNTGNRRVFTVSSGYTLDISSSTLRYGRPTNSGGCLYGDSGSTINLTNTEVTQCRFGDTGYGIGISTYGNLTIINSSIYDNVDGAFNGYGAGIYFSNASGNLIITNSSIYDNQNTSSGVNGGGGIYIDNGTATITNSTITGNRIYQYGGGINVAGSATLYLVNTIVAGNTVGTGSYTDIYRSGTINNNGYNVVGPSYNFVTTTGDWYDSDGDEIYGLSGSSTTGTLNLDSADALNASLNNTYTYAILENSIAINNATSTANNGVNIPSLDQRGAARTGATDIGAYEYGGDFDLYYTATYSAGLNGSLTGSTTQSIARNGSGTAVTPVPDSGYRFASWSDGSTANPRTDTGVTSTISVTASFELASVTLIYNAGANGSVSGSSTQVIDAGANGTEVTATPDSNYHFVSWSDGTTTTARTDTSVMSDLSVTSTFAIDTNVITYSASAGGSITGSSTQAIDYASSTSAVTAVPDTGYTFTAWSDGNTSTTRYETNVTATTTYTASFLINTYTVTYSAGTGGSLTGSSTQSIDHGSDGTEVTAVPDTGYGFVSWSDGITTTARTDTGITTSTSYTASFTTTTFTLNYTAGDNGSISGSSTQVVYYGASGSAVTAVPDSGYKFYVWSDSSTANPRTDTSVTSNLSVTSSFVLLGAPIFSSIDSSVTDSSATITWTTDIAGTSRITYAPTNNYNLSTTETNTSTLVTSHSVELSSLASCSYYRYRVSSGNINGTYTTSTGYIFHTTGCTGLSSITTSTASNAVTSTITTVSLLSSGKGVSLSIPVNYATTTADFQINKLNKTLALGASGRPSGYLEAGDYIYNLKALTEELTTITSFDNDLTITMSYEDADVVGITESSLKIFRWDGSSWNELDSCVVNTSANTVTCDTGNFSDFGLFGQAVVAVDPTSSGGGAFIPPSIPTVKIVPKIENGEIVFDVENVYQMAISDSSDFSGSSWQNYNESYKTSNKTLYIKFRSKDGGVSEVYTVESQKSKAESSDKTDESSPDKIKNIICQSNFTRNLSFGMTGSDVKELQEYLNNNGFVIALSGAGSKGNETNYFGNLTKQALTKYQQTKQLGQTGILDLVTREYIDCKTETSLTIQKPQITSKNAYKFTRDLELGFTGEDVKELQKFLNNKGFILSPAGQPGSPNNETNMFGNATKNALIKFQRSVNLPAYGFFGPMTRDILNNS